MLTTEDTENTEAVNHHMNAALEAVAKVARKLKEERDEALSQIFQAECRAERFCQERDEARDIAENLSKQGLEMMDENRSLKRERDEAREYVDRYRERLDLTPMSWEAAK